MTTLQGPRERMAELDREILRLIAERMEIARSIGQAKRAAGKPLRDWEIEKQVLNRAARTASELGIDAEMAQAVMQSLIEGSRVEQERLHYSVYEGSAQDILVVGGCGKMGQWFSRFFQDQGHRVWVYDPVDPISGLPTVASLEEGLAKTSFAVIAVPLQATPAVIKSIAGMEYEGTVFDIASLKGQLVPAISEARDRGVSIASIHPMFGPAARTLADKVICLCDCGDSQATRSVLRLLEGTAATIVRLSLEEHDRVVTYVLGLSHLINLLFTEVLAESGISYERLKHVGSTTFLSQLATTVTVIQENPDLYYSIQRCNPNTAELYDRLRRAMAAITEAVLSGDSGAFSKMMGKCREWIHAGDPSPAIPV